MPAVYGLLMSDEQAGSPRTIRPSFADAKCAVIKIGSAVLTKGDGLDIPRIRYLAAQVAELKERGVDVVLVSSGAVASGRKILGDRIQQTANMRTLTEQQAAAAVGQVRLAAAWADALEAHGLVAAQVLLTADDATDRERFLNAKHTLQELIELGVVPFVNENDTVASDDVRFEDNDRLSAIVSDVVDADVLLILSVVAGLLDQEGNVIERVEDIPAARALVQDGRSDVGTGGMATKLEAVRIATQAGSNAVIAAGKERDIIPRVFAGEPLGTFFKADIGDTVARKRWLAHATQHAGELVVDDGARRALRDRGASLLPAGIVEVGGEFIAGAVVDIKDKHGVVFARGLAAYGSREMHMLAGKKASEITGVIGFHAGDAAVHRSDLVILTLHDEEQSETEPTPDSEPQPEGNTA